MSRKDYRHIASLIAERMRIYGNEEAAKNALLGFASRFAYEEKKQNDRFEPSRFMQACMGN